MGAANTQQHTGQSDDNNFNQSCLHLFLKKEYEKTKFPFFNIGKLYKAGVYDKNELNRLREKGIVRRRNGFNQVLVEYLGEQ